MEIINKPDYKVHVASWCPDIEDNAMEQIDNLARYPFAYKRIAIMSDCHQGYGMPIGGVMATKDVIVPNAVGVDIGCGMCAVKTDIPVESVTTEFLKKVMGGSKENQGGIRGTIPVGFNHHKKPQDESLMPTVNTDGKYKDIFEKSYPIVSGQHKKALGQLGTLGGGNHFIELQAGSDGFLWVMVHSGSRNLGFTVAKHYNDLAKELNKKWMMAVPPSWDLAFLPIKSDEGQAYIREMNYCVEFALANRKLMMDRVLDAISKAYEIDPVETAPEINIAHNYATLEHHFGQNVWVHRKGATLAREGTKGIIPGSQGTASYIVEGLGNKESFESCSHGAGRTMSRTQAKKELSLVDEIKKLDDQGIIHGIRHVSDLDEASSAYKDIDMVMANQTDLVKVLVELKPLAVVKG